jgi:hypothetical protein
MPFSLPTTKAYVEFIGREKARVYLQCIYCKVKQWIQRELSHIIKSRCACMWIYGGYIWWLSKFYYAPWKYLFVSKLGIIFAWEQRPSYSSLFFSFSDEHLSIHCFKYLKHFCIHFFSTLFLFLFFMDHFCIAPWLISATKLLRDSNKNLEHLFDGRKT